MDRVTSYTDSLAPRTAEGDGGSVLSGQGLAIPPAEGLSPLCIPCLFLRRFPRFPTSAVGELGRGLSWRQVWLLELSYGLGKQERQEEPGRQRAGVSGKEKKGEKEGEGKARAKRQLERHQENVGPRIWKADWAIFRLP